jgi:hypothetical protein
MNTIGVRSSARFALVLAAGAVLVANTARADDNVFNHFGDASTSIAIGYTGSTNKVVMRRQSDGACFSQAVGNGLGLLADTFVHGGAGNDIMWVIEASPSVVLCGVTLGSVRYNGRKLFIDAGLGADILVGDKSATLFGSGGSDIFFTRAVATALSTGPNWFFAEGSQAILNGKSGNDLFCNFSGEPSFAVARGDTGTDSLWGTARFSSSIERVLAANDPTCNNDYNATVVYIAQNWEP